MRAEFFVNKPYYGEGTTLHESMKFFDTEN